MLKVGRLVGAQAIIVGDVQQWERQEQGRTNKVSLSLRMIDVETGQLLFNGEGYLADFTTDDPEGSAHLIVHRILARFGSQTGCWDSGRIGVNWELLEEKGTRFYMVRELRSGLPAEKAGLKVGDRIWPATAPRWPLFDRPGCQAALPGGSGRNAAVGVRRANSPMELFVTAEKRPGL